MAIIKIYEQTTVADGYIAIAGRKFLFIKEFDDRKFLGECPRVGEFINHPEVKGIVKHIIHEYNEEGYFEVIVALESGVL